VSLNLWWKSRDARNAFELICLFYIRVRRREEEEEELCSIYRHPQACSLFPGFYTLEDQEANNLSIYRAITLIPHFLILPAQEDV
jgi:hypothetical protein